MSEDDWAGLVVFLLGGWLVALWRERREVLGCLFKKLASVKMLVGSYRSVVSGSD